MPDKLKVDEFINDYRGGVKDKDMLAKHGISGKQMIALVKRLVNDGTIDKKDYFDRARRIEDREAEQERNFLDSLYHCPLCLHIHPTPFIRCPACGTDITESRNLKGRAHGISLSHGTGTDLVIERETPTGDSAAQVGTEQEKPPPVATAEPALRTDAVTEDDVAGEFEVPEFVERLLGQGLGEIRVFTESDKSQLARDYVVTDVVAINDIAVIFKAEAASGDGLPINVKMFHSEMEQEAGLEAILERLVEFECNMNDPNVVRFLGAAGLDAKGVLLYEHLPKSMDAIIRAEPDGLPFDRIMLLLPQILNGLGYCRLHRGADDVVRRLPHFSLKASNLLLNESEDIVKVDESGLGRAIVDVRGFKGYLWQEPGVDLESLASEAFVLECKFLNMMSVDIYALGVLLYGMATGKQPFSGPGLDEFRFQHVKTFPIPPRVHRHTIPVWLDEMILKCLEKEPENRWRSPTEMELEMGSIAGRGQM